MNNYIPLISYLINKEDNLLKHLKFLRFCKAPSRMANLRWFRKRHRHLVLCLKGLQIPFVSYLLADELPAVLRPLNQVFSLQKSPRVANKKVRS